ncbi:MAG TPA: sigma-70 family RNA polymerase sigma factor [Ferrovibrio sp.]|jgi:RNA polymerase sigma-70 factor (ECF subfamily)|uniref:sigma-70 family RNA polymerase sigma factor n=1 Tax=Ferrovibrio sp. TaxID=1917215 RepID=UPI002B4B8F09|nr:sigma-70 family RNA polymerase sigma factor [Ferrovibrio sp.]HLT75898.1 sigma-70 family RNA polymerase sigma factor [Ferrovibrio sp.]
MLFRRRPHPIEAEIPRLRRFALALMRDRNLADDLVQDCLERALAAWALRRNGPSLRPWLFAILHNTWRSRMRREGSRPDRMPLEAMGAEPAASGGQWERLELRDMDTALGLLPEEQRAVLLLVVLEGLGYEEVARIQDVPVGTVMSRLSRARERLRALTEDRQPPSGTHLRRVK